MRAANPIYHPLDPSKHEIHLLHVVHQENPQPDEHPCYRLTHHSLDSNPEFKALSYTWGKPFLPEWAGNITDIMLEVFPGLLGLVPDAPKLIIVNGHEFSVTENLWDALAVFPTLTSIPSMPFWIDAICINQTDNEEKSTQVEQMHKIYHQAAYVVSWLGPEANDSGSAIAFLDAVGMAGIALLEGNGGDDDFHQLAIRIADVIAAGEAPLQPIQNLARRAYWKRIWILQEMFFADRVLFVCGRSEIRHLYFYEGLRAVNAAMNIISSFSSQEGRLVLNHYACHYSRVILLLNLACFSSVDARKRTLFSSLLNYSPISLQAYGYESSNWRDYIFALLNMTSDHEELGIRPDYT